MKQLFLKSNRLHIRTNEGEYEVSNHHEITFDNPNFYFEKGVLKEIHFTEWPGEVELIWQIQSTTGKNYTWVKCSERYAKDHPGFFPRQVARLIPKEEKKHEWTTEEFMSMVENKEEKKEESAYKEGESSDPQEPTNTQRKKSLLKRAEWLKFCIDIGYTKAHLPALEKIWDDNHDEFGNIVSAPSESQEELWKELGQKWNQKSIIRKGTKEIISELSQEFTINRK